MERHQREPDRIASGAARTTSGDSYGDRQRMTVRTAGRLVGARRAGASRLESTWGSFASVASPKGSSVLPPAPQNIVVAGTNGKGSTSVYLEALLLADGRSVGTTLSPHLSRFNERVRVNGQPVDDATLAMRSRPSKKRAAKRRSRISSSACWRRCSCFDAHAWIRRCSKSGLGGRLDAVNIVDGWVIGHYQHRYRPRRIPRSRSRVDRSGESGHSASGRTVRLWRSVHSLEHRCRRGALEAPLTRFGTDFSAAPTERRLELSKEPVRGRFRGPLATSCCAVQRSHGASGAADCSVFPVRSSGSWTRRAQRASAGTLRTFRLSRCVGDRRRRTQSTWRRVPVGATAGHAARRSNDCGRRILARQGRSGHRSRARAGGG